MQVLRADTTFILLRCKLGRLKIQKILNSTVALSFFTVIGEAPLVTLAFVQICVGKNTISPLSNSQPDYPSPETSCL